MDLQKKKELAEKEIENKKNTIREKYANKRAYIHYITLGCLIIWIISAIIILLYPDECKSLSKKIILIYTTFLIYWIIAYILSYKSIGYIKKINKV